MIDSNRKYIFPFIWVCLITYASVTPSNGIPDFQLFQHADKVIHFLMYLGFSFLLIPSILKKANYLRSYLLSITLSVFIGGSFELIQKFITIDRSASWLDFLANNIGAIVGIFLYKFIVERKKIENWLFKI